MAARILTHSRVSITRLLQTSTRRANRPRTPPWKDIVINRAKGAKLYASPLMYLYQ